MCNKVGLGLLVIALSGCNGGGGDDDVSAGDNTETITGFAADGYLQGATVCLDKNFNSFCDPNEVSANTDSDGRFVLEVSESDAQQYPIVAMVTPSVIDQDTSNFVVNAYTLVSPPGYFEFVSPMTTLIALNSAGYTAESIASSADEIRRSMGLSDEVDLFSDFIAMSKGEQSKDEYQTIYRSSQLVARVLGENLKVFNNGNANGDIDSDKLLVAFDSVKQQMDSIVEMTDSEQFDPDAVIAIKRDEWNKGILNVNPYEIVEGLREKYSLPGAVSGGVFKYYALNGDVTDRATLKLTIPESLFADSMEIKLTNNSGFMHVFSNDDRTNVNLDFDNQVAFELILPEGAMVSDTYTFTIASGEKSRVVMTDILDVSVSQNFDASMLPESLEMYIDYVWGDGYKYVSHPPYDGSLFFSSAFFDSEDGYIDGSGFRKARSTSYCCDNNRSDEAKSILVYSSDGYEPNEQNFVREAYKLPIVQSDTELQLTFARTYQRNKSWGSEFVYQFNIMHVIEDHSVKPFVPILEAVTVERFNETSSRYEFIANFDVDYETMVDLDINSYVEDGNLELSTKLAYDVDYEYNFLDAFFSIQGVPATSSVSGLHRYTGIDVNGKTVVNYDFFVAADDDFPIVDSDSLEVREVGDDWFGLTASLEDDSNDALYFEFSFNAVYGVGQDRESTYMTSSPKKRENTALFSKVELKRLIDSFEQSYGVEVLDVGVEVGIFDSNRNEAVDNRYESDEISLIGSFGVQNLDELLN
ncbi:hypothetical protein [Vibrio barjaei]|uniref:hypothetical protein n=1 Tax=Vibrio barjaei TaxID=1676683 RepID=UPI002283A64B|nr:hypothetical protein [Vibrio barjaei]MCY9870467.1 hypothetical protein [Vibrio barjaei]